MLIKNWMRKEKPITINSDMLSSKAKEIFDEHKLLFIPVVDNGKLRGILARRDLMKAAHHVSATGSIHELDYFNNSLKVKDLMVRKPITMSINDSVRKALAEGKKLGRSFYPVMDGDKLVGTVSDLDIYNSLSQIMGVDEVVCGISIDGEDLKNCSVADIVRGIYNAGGTLFSLFTFKQVDSNRERIFIRFKSEDKEKVISELRKIGCKMSIEEE